MPNLMTTNHPAWERFFAQLVSKMDFKAKANKDGGEETYRFKCDSTLSKSKAILEKMGGFGVAETLDYFQDNGGHCDCEVVFNIAANKEWTDHDEIKES